MDYIKIAEILADILDTRFGAGSFRFGMSAIIDLFPGFGDILAAMLSFYIVWVALKMDVRSEIVSRMIRNIVIVFLVGSVPVVGDIIYILAQVNIRNVKLLKENLPQKIIEGEIVRE